MFILNQILIIFGFTLLGEGVASILPVPVPGSVLGLLFLYLALTLKWVRLGQIEKTGNWLKDNMAFFFVPLTVGLMESWQLFERQLIPLIILVLISTLITLLISALITDKVIQKEGEKTYGKHRS